jgi:hypothetical protein
MTRRIVNLASLSSDALADLERRTDGHLSLLDVFDWARSPEAITARTEVVSAVITQDEFTHDCIVPLTNGLFLVYDTT